MRRIMDSDKINRWLTLGANIGVLSGLILVALQINQNSEIAKAQLANDYYLADEELVLDRVGYLRWHLGNSVGEKWWATSKRFYSKEFADLIDDALARDDFGSNRRKIDSMLVGEESVTGTND
jgi:hypothetical protein